MKRFFIVMAAALASVALTVAPAHAATWMFHHADASRDTWIDPGIHPSARQKAQTDIVSVAYGRGTARVWFRLQFRDLVKSIHRPTIMLSSDSNWNMGLAAGAARPRLLNNPAGRSVCQRKGRAAIDYAANTIQISFPKTCFGKGYVWWHPYYMATYEASAWPAGRVVGDTGPTGASFAPNP